MAKKMNNKRNGKECKQCQIMFQKIAIKTCLFQHTSGCCKKTRKYSKQRPEAKLQRGNQHVSIVCCRELAAVHRPKKCRFTGTYSISRKATLSYLIHKCHCLTSKFHCESVCFRYPNKSACEYLSDSFLKQKWTLATQQVQRENLQMSLFTSPVKS